MSAGDPVRARRWRRLWPLAALVAVLAVLAAIGASVPAGRLGDVQTDTLGPEPGEPLARYRERAAQTLRDPGPEQRWGLVFVDAPVAPEVAAGLVTGVRVSQVVITLAQGEDVWTDWIDVAVTPTSREEGEAALREALRLSAARLQDSVDPRDVAARGALLEGCACVKALVVRADGGALRDIAERPGVGAVEALPADAVHGRFSVRPG